MEDRMELLIQSYGIDALLAEHEINPMIVLKFLLDEGLIELNPYFEGEDD